jgi:hypothetical protein
MALEGTLLGYDPYFFWLLVLLQLGSTNNIFSLLNYVDSLVDERGTSVTKKAIQELDCLITKQKSTDANNNLNRQLFSLIISE